MARSKLGVPATTAARPSPLKLPLPLDMVDIVRETSLQ
jgi:hypothetical protein